MADASKFAQFIASKKIDSRRILAASHALETLTLEDRKIKLAKRAGKKEGADAKPEALGADLKQYEAALKKRFVSGQSKPAKLTLKIGDGLLQEYVVRLLDIANQVGFTDIAPIPLDPKKQ